MADLIAIGRPDVGPSDQAMDEVVRLSRELIIQPEVEKSGVDKAFLAGSGT